MTPHIFRRVCLVNSLFCLLSAVLWSSNDPVPVSPRLVVVVSLSKDCLCGSKCVLRGKSCSKFYMSFLIIRCSYWCGISSLLSLAFVAASHLPTRPSRFWEQIAVDNETSWTKGVSWHQSESVNTSFSWPSCTSTCPFWLLVLICLPKIRPDRPYKLALSMNPPGVPEDSLDTRDVFVDLGTEKHAASCCMSRCSRFLPIPPAFLGSPELIWVSCGNQFLLDWIVTFLHANIVLKCATRLCLDSSLFTPHWQYHCLWQDARLCLACCLVSTCEALMNCAPIAADSSWGSHNSIWAEL